MLRYYKLQCLSVLFLIIVSTMASVAGTLFMKNLIDDYILPFIGSSNPDFGPLFRVLVKMAFIYAAGVLSVWAYNRIMVNVTQGTMRNIRNDLFSHMETCRRLF